MSSLLFYQTLLSEYPSFGLRSRMYGPRICLVLGSLRLFASFKLFFLDFVCLLFFPFILALFLAFVLMLSLELVDIPLIFSFPASPLVPDFQQRILLGIAEARPVNVKNDRISEAPQDLCWREVLYVGQM